MCRVIHLNLQVQKKEKYQFLREVHQSGYRRCASAPQKFGAR